MVKRDGGLTVLESSRQAGSQAGRGRYDRLWAKRGSFQVEGGAGGRVRAPAGFEQICLGTEQTASCHDVGLGSTN